MTASAEIWLTWSTSARVPTGSRSCVPLSNRSANDSRARNDTDRVVGSTRGRMLVTRPTTRPWTSTLVSTVSPCALAARM